MEGAEPSWPRWQLFLLEAFRHGRRPATALLTFLLTATGAIVLSVTTGLMAHDVVVLAERGQPAYITVEDVSNRNQNVKGTYETGPAGTEVFLDDSIGHPAVGDRLAVIYDPHQPTRAKDARIGWWRGHYLFPLGFTTLAGIMAFIHFRWWRWLRIQAHRQSPGANQR